ncbi:unnamed protein product [Closterium sp. NIES-65]|nr:unnamed protein product [Closterium sp. NIES-65]
MALKDKVVLKMGDTIVDVLMGPVYVESLVRHYPNHAVFSPADASSASLFAKREGPLPPGRVLKPGRCYHLVRKAQGKGGVTGGAECAHADEGGTAGRKPPRDLRKTPSANGRNERNLSPPSAHPQSAVPPLVHVPARSPPRVTIFVKPRHRVNHSTSALPDVSPDASPPHARTSAAAAPAPFATGVHSPAHADGGASRRRAGETGGMALNGKTGESHAAQGAGLAVSPGRLMVPALRRSRRGMHRPCKSLSGSPEEIRGLAEEAWGGDDDGGKAGDGRWRSAHVTPLGSAHATPHGSPYGSAHASPLRGSLPASCSKAAAPPCASALRPRTAGGERGQGEEGGGEEEEGGEMRGDGKAGDKGEQGWAEALVERMRQLSPLRGRSSLRGRSLQRGCSPVGGRAEGQRSPDLARPPCAVPRGSSFSPPRMAFDNGEHASQYPEPRPPMLHPPTPVLFLTRPAHSSPPPSQRCAASATPSQHSPLYVAAPSHRSPPHDDTHGRYQGASMSPRPASPCPVSDGEGRGEIITEMDTEMDTEMWHDGAGNEWTRQGQQGQQGPQGQQGQQQGGRREEARSELKRKARDKRSEGDRAKQGSRGREDSGSEGRGRERSPLRRLLHALSLDATGSEGDNPKHGSDSEGRGQEGRGQDRSPLRRLLHAISLDAPSRPARARRAVDDSLVGRSSKGKSAHGTQGVAAATTAGAAGTAAAAEEDIEWQAAVQAFRRRVEVLNGECLFNWSTVTAGKEERRAVMWKPDLPDVQEASDAGSFAAPITRHKRTLSAQITSWLS